MEIWPTGTAKRLYIETYNLARNTLDGMKLIVDAVQELNGVEKTHASVNPVMVLG